MAENHISAAEWIIANTINEAARGDSAELATHIVAAWEKGGTISLRSLPARRTPLSVLSPSTADARDATTRSPRRWPRLDFRDC